jgi:hypothetical protein
MAHTEVSHTYLTTTCYAIKVATSLAVLKLPRERDSLRAIIVAARGSLL